MPNYPYTFQLPPLNVQDIPNDGVAGEFLGINGSGVLDWLPVATSGGDMLKADNLSGLTNYATARTNIGLGTTSTPTFANLTLTSPSLTSDAPVTISQTWNNAAVAFTGLKVNAAGTSGTNSASGSLLLDLQLNTASQFSVRKDGFTLISGTGLGVSNIYTTGGGQVASTIAGGINVVSTLSLSGNTFLVNDGAANTLALRNGANAQTFRVYNTYSNAGVDVEYLQLSTSASGFRVGTNSSGSGSSRPLFLGVGGGSQWQINTAGHIGTFGSDNLYDIGASGANRPRNVYVGSDVIASNNVGAGAGGYLNWFGRSIMGSPSNGVISLLNNAGADFNRLQFGGTTNLFPAIKRSTTTLQARLADDSAFAPIQGKLTTDTAYTGTVVAATGYITIYDSTGTAYRVPCAV